MDIKKILSKFSGFSNLNFLATQVVEGQISGLHPSPFHGFSSEFAEHKTYNIGDNLKHVDWKLYGKTDKLFIKKFQDETNLRCHFILDTSSSMYYPKAQNTKNSFNKVGYSCLTIAYLMELLKKQRDRFGLSLFNEDCDFFAPERGNQRHFMNLLEMLEKTSLEIPKLQKTDIGSHLHKVSQKLQKRSMVVLFSDLMHPKKDLEAFFEGINHLRHQQNEVIIFHTLDTQTEIDFQLGDEPKKLIDLETNESLTLFPDEYQKSYQEQTKQWLNEIKTLALKHKISYYHTDIQKDFYKTITTFLNVREKNSK